MSEVMRCHSGISKVDALVTALHMIANYRAAAHGYDYDMGLEKRTFDEDEVVCMERIAQDALDVWGDNDDTS